MFESVAISAKREDILWRIIVVIMIAMVGIELAIIERLKSAAFTGVFQVLTILSAILDPVLAVRNIFHPKTGGFDRTIGDASDREVRMRVLVLARFFPAGSAGRALA